MALEAANVGLFCQMITIPLFKEHKILVQVAGHASYTIKLLPPLIIDEADCDWIARGFEATIAEAHNLGAVWSLGKTLALLTRCRQERPPSAMIVAALDLAAWTYLLLAHGRFWETNCLEKFANISREQWPDVWRGYACSAMKREVLDKTLPLCSPTTIPV